ncbi:MAG: Cof-type HAD-IIB family hydrolase [Clostridium sp.]|nr:Cof-type HAD-IIB family hydrolase [Clostridium sp.]
MKYKLLCIDIDGTLLTSKKTISDITKRSIKKASDLGVRIVVSTGRIYSNAAFYSELLGVEPVVIASNGAIIKEKKSENEIYRSALTKDDIEKVLKICKRHRVKVNFNTQSRVLCQSRLVYFLTKYFYLKFIFKNDNGKMDVQLLKGKDSTRKLIENCGDKIIKCEVLDSSSKRIRDAKDELKSIENLETVSSYMRNIEITSKCVSKGRAVEELAKYYNIKREEIISIGDSENDLSMIQYAGLGVAMGNGNSIVKDSADYITETNDNNGVAKVIDKFILNG